MRTHAISSLSLPGWLSWVNKEADKRVNLADMQVSRMGLGTWSWGNQFLWGYDESMDEELKRVFDLAISKGVNLFDTADSYGTGRLNGKSELLLGQFIRDQRAKGNAREIHIATKFAAYPWRILPNQIVAACEGSLRRLKLDQLSIGQLHWSASNYAPLQEVALVNGLADCHDKGLIRAVGVSNYGPKELRQVHRKFKKRGIDLASAQIQFSLLSYGPEQQEAKEVCDELGVSLISYSPLALGVLSGKYDDSNLPDGPRGFLFKEILPKAQPLLEVLKLIAKERSKTPSQVAIAWCISKGTIPIPGAKDVNQAEENLGAIGIRLSEGEVRALDEAALTLAKGNKTVMIQNIFQTR
jgi:pyridoxine 4-dehydrogenase